jgi:predicted PurR-regulated permease PerM
MAEGAPNDISDLTIFRRTLVVAAGIGLAIALWRLTDLILLLLAGALVAFIFYKFGELIQRRLKVPHALALTLAVLLPILFVGFVFAAFGSLMADQFALLFAQLPGAWAVVQDWLQNTDMGRKMSEQAGSYMPEGARIVAVVQTVASSLGTVVTSLVVVLVAGVYLAAQPRLYGRGVLHLVPPHARHKTVTTVRAIADAISSWLKAQGVSMIFVGIFTGVALAIVGIPAAPAIGLVAGLCEFVPYLGTIVVAIPAILIGFSISPETGVWTIIALVIVQQVQGNIVTPLVQSSMAELPPALTVFSLIASGVLLGPMGVILAVPLTVVLQTLVKELVAYAPAHEHAHEQGAIHAPPPPTAG